jgi:hypothetical protein
VPLNKDKLREKIEAEQRMKEELAKQELLKRRLEIVREGARLYSQGKIAEALPYLHRYITILEDWKKVPRGGLTPGAFDPKVDLVELVLISGVYWDLAKAYDRASTREQLRQFQLALQKYVMFSKGFTYQPMAAEAVRKYMTNGKSIHTSDFKVAYKELANEKCFIATELAEHLDEDTLPILRRFRDEQLLVSFGSFGLFLVDCYYKLGPKLAQLLSRRSESLRKFCAWGLDRIASIISATFPCAQDKPQNQDQSGTNPR